MPPSTKRLRSFSAPVTPLFFYELQLRILRLLANRPHFVPMDFPLFPPSPDGLLLSLVPSPAIFRSPPLFMGASNIPQPSTTTPSFGRVSWPSLPKLRHAFFFLRPPGCSFQPSDSVFTFSTQTPTPAYPFSTLPFFAMFRLRLTSPQRGSFFLPGVGRFAWPLSSCFLFFFGYSGLLRRVFFSDLQGASSTLGVSLSVSFCCRPHSYYEGFRFPWSASFTLFPSFDTFPSLSCDMCFR